MAAIAFFPLFGSGIINSSSTRKQNHFGINNQPLSRWKTCIVCEVYHNSFGDPYKCCQLYLQSWTKMLRKLDVTTSSFKIKLLKALATTNTPPPTPPKKNNVKVRVDHVWPWPNVLDQGGARGGNIAVKSRTLRRQLQLHNWLHVIIPSQPTTATASQLSIWDATNKVTYLRIIYF